MNETLTAIFKAVDTISPTLKQIEGNTSKLQSSVSGSMSMIGKSIAAGFSVGAITMAIASDVTLRCIDCGNTFTFEVGEQRHFDRGRPVQPAAAAVASSKICWPRDAAVAVNERSRGVRPVVATTSRRASVSQHAARR